MRIITSSNPKRVFGKTYVIAVSFGLVAGSAGAGGCSFAGATEPAPIDDMAGTTQGRDVPDAASTAVDEVIKAAGSGVDDSDKGPPPLPVVRRADGTMGVDGPHAAVLAVVHLEGDVTVDFVSDDDGVVAVGVGGPLEAQEVDNVMRKMATSASPADLFHRITSETVPLELDRRSQNAVARGNWKPGGTIDAISRGTSAGSSKSSAEMNATNPATSAAWCDLLDVHGSPKIAESLGKCATYNRDAYDDTTWWVDDNIAFTGHVIGVEGLSNWNVQKRNCNTCNWHVLYEKLVSSGYHYYFPYSNNNDDHRINSRFTSLANGSVQRHHVVRCHDWNTRTQPTSGLAGGCSIWYQNAQHENLELYCVNSFVYQGPDPSNIFTSGYWDGDGRRHTCYRL